MSRYKLYVKLRGRWKLLCEVEGNTHSQAFHKAIVCLEPSHYDKAIRLEPVVEPKRG
jgi:hypothetical protein